MKETETQSDMNKPLTKGDFLVFHLNQWIELYTALFCIIGIFGLFFAGRGIYRFFTHATYYGIFDVAGSILLFAFSKGCARKGASLRSKQKRILERMSS